MHFYNYQKPDILVQCLKLIIVGKLAFHKGITLTHQSEFILPFNLPLLNFIY